VPKADGLPKYRQILDDVRREIQTGRHKPGDRLPSEADLGTKYDVSRLTIQRVLKELQIEDLIERRAGSGTYIRRRVEVTGHLFGLLIPGLGETEIFEPMCQGMGKAGRSGGHALLWGDTGHGAADREHQARQLCADYIDRKVSGVFFAPIEFLSNMDEVNVSIAEAISSAGIPVVLLDRCIEAYPERSRFDLVGIDNRRIGCRITNHMLSQGASNPIFFDKPYSAPTVALRARGFRDAFPAGKIVHGDPSDRCMVRGMMHEHHPDGIVCANDATAAKLMQSLEEIGYRIPDSVRITGIDDVRYANLLTVPLTTMRQPCMEIGAMAVHLMLSRIAQPDLPARDMFLDCKLITRQSCGALR
jgi:GntR family transcriptional regulator, arabinose operon transcriptional repressor